MHRRELQRYRDNITMYIGVFIRTEDFPELEMIDNLEDMHFFINLVKDHSIKQWTGTVYDSHDGNFKPLDEATTEHCIFYKTEYPLDMHISEEYLFADLQEALWPALRENDIDLDEDRSDMLLEGMSCGILCILN